MTLLDILPSLRATAAPRLDPALWPTTTHYDEHGRVTVGGTSLVDVADEHGTPCYVVDEQDVRDRCATYRSTFPDAEVAYAGKAMLTTAIARWVTEEGLALDVCSGGELAIALAAGVDPARIVLHGNATPPDEVRAALLAGVGRIVLDSPTLLVSLAAQVRRRQKVLLRVTPDVAIGGHAAVATGVLDQKFGFPLSTGQAAEAVRRVLEQHSLELVGLHCHIGSQVSEVEPYRQALRRVLHAMADVRDVHGVVLGELDLGGGHGVPSSGDHAALDLPALADVIRSTVAEVCAERDFPAPRITLEPGRAVVARAGVTLYRVVSVKSVRGGRTFVAVDGGMSDNPRVSLYGAQYDVVVVNRHPVGPTHPVTVVGRHCEAGDVIARDVEMPTDLHPGDLLGVPCTGAYHHSMASTYNAVGRPPVVGVRDGATRVLIRRETAEDLLARDLG